MVMDTSLYYRLGPALSRNAFWYFIVGGRGTGKTFAAKEWAIRDFIKNGNQFIYLRRYQTDLHSRHTWFADIAHKFPEYGFRVNGRVAEMTRNPDDKRPTWEIMGWFVALSNAQSKKSVAYPRVTKIIFDEFIIEKGAVQYLPNEARQMMDFYSTVDRYNDRVRVLFLANSVSITNPYFLEWKIEPTSEWVTRQNGYICCHFLNNEDFNNAVSQTRFGQFIDGTEYADYSIGNNFRDNHGNMIAPKHPKAVYLLTLETLGGTFSLWRDDDSYPNAFGFHASEKRPKVEILYTTEPNMMDADKALLSYSDKLSQYFRSAFKRGRMTFDNPRTRNAFIQIFKR